MKTKDLIDSYLYDLEKANNVLRDASRHRENVKEKFLYTVDLTPMDTIELTVPPTKYPYITSGEYVIVDMWMLLTGECLCMRVRDMDSMEYDIQIPIRKLEKMIKLIRRDI